MVTLNFDFNRFFISNNRDSKKVLFSKESKSYVTAGLPTCSNRLSFKVATKSNIGNNGKGCFYF